MRKVESHMPSKETQMATDAPNCSSLFDEDESEIHNLLESIQDYESNQSGEESMNMSSDLWLIGDKDNSMLFNKENEHMIGSYNRPLRVDKLSLTQKLTGLKQIEEDDDDGDVMIKSFDNA